MEGAVASAPRTEFLPATPGWHLHVGTVQLFIVGPGPEAWLACSEASYLGQVGTDEERNLARRALRFLSLRHAKDMDAGVDTIRHAMFFARTGKSVELPRRQTEPEISRAREWTTPPPEGPLCPFSAQEIVQIIAKIHKVDAALLVQRRIGQLKVEQARTLAMCLVKKNSTWTWSRCSAFFGSSHGLIQRAVERHAVLMEKDKSYRRKAEAAELALRGEVAPPRPRLEEVSP